MSDDQIETEEFFSLLEKLMSTPTAPFREHRIRDAIRAEAGRRGGVSVREDAWGNMLVSHAAPDGSEDCVFVAHMDHPGFVDGEFLGSIRSEYRHAGNRVVDLGNGIGMWDLPTFHRGDGWIRGRACDDLVGCAVALSSVFHHARIGSGHRVHALMTVAEEVGLFGAALACDAGTIPSKATIVSLETSPCLAEKQFHGGCIVRVGDRGSVFTPAITRSLLDAARIGKISHQRCLMDGGSCEGTVFFEAGYETGALCVALGNPHNQGAGAGVEMEYVSESDVLEMLRLAVTAPKFLAHRGDKCSERLQSFIERAKAGFRI